MSLQGRSQELEMGGAKLLGEGSGGRLRPPVGPGQRFIHSYIQMYELYVNYILQKQQLTYMQGLKKEKKTQQNFHN